MDLTRIRRIRVANFLVFLYLLWWRAFDWRWPVAAAVIAIGWAISDEFHQLFVAGRHGSPIDVLIDSTGVLLAYLLIRWRRQAA